MKLNELIEKFHRLNDETNDSNFKKSAKKMINLLEQINAMDIKIDEKEKIQNSINPFLKNIKTQEDLTLGLKKLRKLLIENFGFLPANYYVSLGLGIGIALGTSLGISLGSPFNKGLIFGPMIGLIIGLIVGLMVGMFLDKKQESENRTLKNL